jgi:hypothetical protein
MVLGPQQMPPQGARALVGALLGGRRRGPEVAATLDESQPGAATLEFINEGAETAIGLRCLYLDAYGHLVRQSLGDLSPADSATCRIEVAAQDRFQCVWACDDAKRGLRLWSYDGRYKRLRREKPGSDEAFFRAAYG